MRLNIVTKLSLPRTVLDTEYNYLSMSFHCFFFFFQEFRLKYFYTVMGFPRVINKGLFYFKIL